MSYFVPCSDDHQVSRPPIPTSRCVSPAVLCASCTVKDNKVINCQEHVTESDKFVLITSVAPLVDNIKVMRPIPGFLYHGYGSSDNESGPNSLPPSAARADTTPTFVCNVEVKLNSFDKFRFLPDEEAIMRQLNQRQQARSSINNTTTTTMTNVTPTTVTAAASMTQSNGITYIPYVQYCSTCRGPDYLCIDCANDDDFAPQLSSAQLKGHKMANSDSTNSLSSTNSDESSNSLRRYTTSTTVDSSPSKTLNPRVKPFEYTATLPTVQSPVDVSSISATSPTANSDYGTPTEPACFASPSRPPRWNRWKFGPRSHLAAKWANSNSYGAHWNQGKGRFNNGGSRFTGKARGNLGDYALSEDVIEDEKEACETEAPATINKDRSKTVGKVIGLDGRWVPSNEFFKNGNKFCNINVPINEPWLSINQRNNYLLGRRIPFRKAFPANYAAAKASKESAVLLKTETNFPKLGDGLSPTILNSKVNKALDFAAVASARAPPSRTAIAFPPIVGGNNSLDISTSDALGITIAPAAVHSYATAARRTKKGCGDCKGVTVLPCAGCGCGAFMKVKV